jgi:hypothetical protein
VLSGPNAPHRPTLVSALVVILVIVVLYHLLFHRGR